MSQQFRLIAVLGFALHCITSYAQVPQGQILGSIRDTSGAVVPGVAVSLKNQLTGIERKSTTNDEGNFTFSYLDSGLYTLVAEKTGFKAVVSSDIRVQVADRRRVDLRLEVGEVTTRVDVGTAVALLDTDNATVGTVLSQREVTGMPLNGREFSQLAALMPGVRAVGTNGGAGFITSISTSIQVGGTPSSKNNYNYDGVDNTLNRVKGPAMNPSIDSIQEFRIDRSQFQAEYGRGGALIDLATKSGTNSFHGTAWEYLRNYKLNAGNFVTHRQDTLKRNQFGANLGGPIFRNKAFFFFNWESQRERSSIQPLGSVFTDRMRGGDLREFPETIKDPRTGQVFANNQIPANRLNPISLALIDAYMAKPNVGAGILNNFIRPFVTSSDRDQYIARVDYQLSSNDRLFGRYSGQWRNGADPPLDANSVNTTTDFKFYNVGAGWNRNWSPTFLTDVRFGFHGERLLQNSQQLAKYASPNVPLAIGETQPPPNRVPIVMIAPFYGFAEWGFPVNIPQNSYELLANATFIKGKHVIKAGYVGRAQTTDHLQDGGSPEILNFNGAYSGNGVGDFLLGLPFVAQNKLTWIPRSQHYGDHSAYVQDDWKITPSLTLNIGLRYELHTQPSEQRDLWSSFDPGLGRIIVAGNGINNQFTNPLTLNSWQSLLASVSQTNLPRHTLAFGDHNDFAPRFGFAWRPFRDNKTVVRGGYGIFYLLEDGQWQGDIADYSVPYGGIVRVTDAASDPNFNLVAPWARPGIAVPSPTALYRDPHMRDPYMQHFSLGVQRQLPWSLVAEVNFQDQNSKKLETVGWNLNQPRAGLSTAPLQDRRPYPYMGSLISGYTHEGKTRYDALELIVRKSSAHFTFEWSHVWSKNIGRLDFPDPYNRDMFRGPVNFVPHQDKVHFIADLPFGKGRRFLNQKGVANAIVGGWTVSGISTLYQSGAPLTLSWNADPSNTGTFVARPTRVCSGKVSNPSPAQWFDTSCFTAPAPGTFGNSGTGIFFGPSSFFADFAVHKDFPILEKAKVQFRTEMFNAFNHPNLALPGTVANVPSNFGKIFTKTLTPRVIQFALRFEF